MARPKTKEDLIIEATKAYEKLNDYIKNMSEEDLNTYFNFSSLLKKEAHWKRDKNLRDVLMHLYEWQQLLINWINNNMNGIKTNFLLEGYNWSNYALMNQMFYEKNQNVSLEVPKQYNQKL